jgi:alpha-amylase
MCFTGVDYAHNLNENGIYRILNGYGDTWEKVIGDEKGNYDTQPLQALEATVEA